MEMGERVREGQGKRNVPVLVATAGFPPIPGGTPVIMKNLVNGLDPGEVVLATVQPHSSRPKEACPHDCHFVLRETHLPRRLEKIRRYLARPLVERRLMRLARRHGCASVVGVYPDLLFLDASERAARRLGLPFFPYLHDTVTEAASATRFAGWAEAVQRRVFASADRVLVATRGLEELYERKYGIRAVALVHIFPEPVPGKLPASSPSKMALFWGGGAYSINSRSLKRVFDAGRRIDGLRMTMATAQGREELAGEGFDTSRLDLAFIPTAERPRYLEFMKEHAVLVLALNWPDETHVHEDELSTIFPTKTPEYLASGRPIIVHCPPHYHLARFFQQHRCGEVVPERDGKRLEEVLRRLLDDPAHARELATNALEAVKVFVPENVIPLFRRVVLGEGATDEPAAAPGAAV